MRLFTSELQYLSELYNRLRHELSLHPPQGAEPRLTALTETVLKNRELFIRVEQMNDRLAQLSEDWQSFREHLNPQPRKSIQALAASVTKQAAELALLMEQRRADLEEERCKLEKALDEVRQGARYLASVKPVKANYPKFVDSLG